MSKIAFPDKNIGDLFTAAECNEIKAVVNANDTAAAATASEVSTLQTDVSGVQNAVIDVQANKADKTEIPNWGNISGKPAVVAAGSTQAAARTAIGAGTSNLSLGTTASTALAGNTAIPTIPDVIPQAEAESGTSTTQRTITAQRLNQAIQALAPTGGGGVQSVTGTAVDNTDPLNPVIDAEALSSVPVTGITNDAGGSYVVGRNSGVGGNPSVPVPMSNTNTTGLSVVQRDSSGNVIANSFIYEQEAVSGTVLSFAGGCTKTDTISANKTYTFSNGQDGISMVVQVTNSGASEITCTFTGATLAAGHDGTIPAGRWAWFTFAQIGGNIGGTKLAF